MKNPLKEIQSAYIEKPVICVLLTALLMTLPFIGISDFYTKGEPREASLAISMLKDGNWILPVGYADEIAYKPPLMHWLIAIFSLVSGSVNEFTSRLPSALALTGLTMVTLLFLLKRKSTLEAVLTSLIMLTCFELHRSSLECRVDMTLAFFMGAAQIGLFKWEERGLKGYPFLTAILLACACLVKGPVGAVLPCLVFGIYLLIRNYSFRKTFLKCAIVALPPLAVLCVWYYLAYLQDGQHFLDIIFAENIGRFLGMKREALGINYDLGHEGPFWYYLPALLAGLLPWSLVALGAAFRFGFKKWWKGKQKEESYSLRRFIPKDKLALYSLVVIIFYLLFYSIPSSKRSVYILPIYPFVCFLLADICIWTTKTSPKILKFLYDFILSVCILLILIGGTLAIYPGVLSGIFAEGSRTYYDASLIAGAFGHPSAVGILFTIFFLVTLFFSFGIRRSANAKSLLFGLFTTFIALQLFLEGEVYPAYKNGYSLKPLAKELSTRYDLQKDCYVMNNLKFYRNLYGLSFYTGNSFKNFEKQLPDHGYLLAGKKKLGLVRDKYAGRYSFEELEHSDSYNEIKDEIIVCKIIKL